MKKVFSLLLALFILSPLFLKVNAETSISKNLTNITKIDSEQINDDLLFQQYTIDSSYDANAAKTTRDVFNYTLKQTSDTKLASWTYSNPDKFVLKNLIEIAEDYERNHPGWIVLGGVNAEGYYEEELTNAFMQDGNLIRKDVSSECFKELIGFKPNGDKVIKQVPRTTDYARLIVDDSKYDIKYINSLPENSTDVGILTIDLTQYLDLTGYTVIESSYSLYRRTRKMVAPSLNGPNMGIFIDGTVNGTVNLSTIRDIPKGKFYIITKNQTIVEQLTSNKKVKCAYELLDEYSDVETMVGYMYKLVIDGESVPASFVDTADDGQKVIYDCAYYKSVAKERCGIGFKDDGSIMLMTANTDKRGPTQYEFGEMFRQFGCNEAYQFDGGGSVTFIKRNQYGQLEMLNTPGDNQIRSIMSGLFIVTRDPAYEQNNDKTTTSSITLNRKDVSFTNDITDLVVKLDGKEYTPINDEIVITGLNDDKEYELEVSYTYLGEQCKAVLRTKTKKFTPILTILPLATGFNITLDNSDSSFKVLKIDFDVSDVPYTLDSENLVIDDLNKDTDYLISYICYYENIATGEKLQKSYAPQTYHTLVNVLPKIELFEITKITKSKITLEYKYTDEDSLVKKAIVICNGEEHELTVKSGRLVISDADTEFVDYQMILEIQYETKDGKSRTLRSQKLTVEKTHVHNWVDATCTEAKHCKTCDAVEGDPLGHNWVEATCTEEKHCKVCNAVEGEPLGHDWVDATTEHPKTCNRCHLTEGEPLKPNTSDKTKKSCKKSLDYLVSLVAMTSMLIFVIRKKNN